MHPSEPPPDAVPDTSEAPAVSVILPVFNGAATIRQAIDSLLSQEGVALEVVVVDDGSVDGTALAVAEYDEDPRVRVLRQPTNLGLVAALNRGIAAARHAFVARLDADDTALPGRLAHQAAALAADPSMVLHATAYERVHPDGTVLAPSAPPRTHGGLAMACWQGNQLCHSAVMFRRDAVTSVGGYRSERYPAEDFDLWLRLVEVGRYAGSDVVGTRYLVNPDGISHQHSTRQQLIVQEIIDEHCVARCGQPLPGPGSSASVRLRHLARTRRAVLNELRRRGIASDDVDATAYRLAMATLRTHPRVARQLFTAMWAPRIWLSQVRRQPPRAPDGPHVARGDD